MRGAFEVSKSLANDVEHAPPTSLIEEVNHDLGDERHPVADTRLLVLPGRCFERPVDEHRAADDILLRDKSKIAAVVADVTIVTHPEVAARRNHQLTILDIGTHLQMP